MLNDAFSYLSPTNSIGCGVVQHLNHLFFILRKFLLC